MRELILSVILYLSRFYDDIIIQYKLFMIFIYVKLNIDYNSPYKFIHSHQLNNNRINLYFYYFKLNDEDKDYVQWKPFESYMNTFTDFEWEIEIYNKLYKRGKRASFGKMVLNKIINID